MIKPEFKDLFDHYLEQYEKINLLSFHAISKENFLDYAQSYIDKNDITNKYEFLYFMRHMIKVLSGIYDSHTCYNLMSVNIPMNFKIIGNEVLVNYPQEEKGNKLESINDIPIDLIMKEFEDCIPFATEGFKNYTIEAYLFKIPCLLSLPSLRNSKSFTFKLTTTDNKEYSRTFDTSITDYPNAFSSDEYYYGNPGHYEFRDNSLIIEHSTVVNQYAGQLKERYEELSKKDLSNIDKIIVDIRINTGGTSKNNNYLFDFLDKNKDKELIALTGYRIFSGGRFALMGLIERGALTIGEKIATPINCCGNCKELESDINDGKLRIAESYLDPRRHIQANNKEQLEKYFKEEDFEPYFFKPDIFVTQTKEHFINGKDTILDYALNYQKEKTHR